MRDGFSLHIPISHLIDASSRSFLAPFYLQISQRWRVRCVGRLLRNRRYLGMQTGLEALILFPLESSPVTKSSAFSGRKGRIVYLECRWSLDSPCSLANCLILFSSLIGQCSLVSIQSHSNDHRVPALAMIVSPFRSEGRGVGDGARRVLWARRSFTIVAIARCSSGQMFSGAETAAF